MRDELGFDDVRTVLASGNVSFEASTPASRRAKLKATIEAALRDRFGYDAWIVLVTRAEVEKAIERSRSTRPSPTASRGWSSAPTTPCCDELTGAAASLDDAADPVERGAGVIYWNPVKGTTVDTPFGKLLRERHTGRRPRTAICARSRRSSAVTVRAAS